MAAYVRALQLSQGATTADVPSGAQVRDLKDLATEAGHADYAQPWSLPASTAVQALPHVNVEGNPGNAPANANTPKIVVPATKTAPAAAK